MCRSSSPAARAVVWWVDLRPTGVDEAYGVICGALPDPVAMSRMRLAWRGCLMLRGADGGALAVSDLLYGATGSPTGSSHNI